MAASAVNAATANEVLAIPLRTEREIILEQTSIFDDDVEAAELRIKRKEIGAVIQGIVNGETAAEQRGMAIILNDQKASAT